MKKRDPQQRLNNKKCRHPSMMNMLPIQCQAHHLMSPRSSQKQQEEKKVEKEIPREHTKGKTNVHTKKGNSISSQKNGQHKTNKS